MKKWTYIILAIIGSIILCSCQELIDEMNKSNGSSSSDTYSTASSDSNKMEDTEVESTKKDNDETEKDTQKENDVDYLIEEIIPIFDDAAVLDVEKLDLSNYEAGDVITLGKYEQDGDEENGKEDIEWIILKKDDDYAFLLSKYALDCMNAFWETEPSKDGGKSHWSDSRLRSVLNGSFFSDAFDEVEKKIILTAEITTYDKQVFVSPDKYSTVLSTKDKIFIMSFTDMTNKSYGFHESWAKENSARVCKATKYATSKNKFGNKPYVDGVKYWLRTQGETLDLNPNQKYKYRRYLSQMEYVRENGQIHTGGDGSNTYYVRPACIIRIR